MKDIPFSPQAPDIPEHCCSVSRAFQRSLPVHTIKTLVPTILVGGLLNSSCSRNHEEADAGAPPASVNQEALSPGQDTEGVITWSAGKDGDEVTLEPGQTLIINLEVNRGTGFIWTPKKTDTALYEWTNDGALPEAEVEGPPGGATNQSFQLKALAVGEATLEFEYKRPWEDEQPAKIQSLKLDIQDPSR